MSSTLFVPDASPDLPLSPASAQPPKLAPFNPTSDEAIAAAVELARFQDGETVVDLGCGDGRVLVAMARSHPSITCVGIEAAQLHAERAQARVAAEPEGVRHRVRIIHGDAAGGSAAEALSLASVVFVYLVPAGLAVVAPLLLPRVERGEVRVVSNIFSIKGWAERGLLREKRATSTAGLAVYLYAAGGTESAGAGEGEGAKEVGEGAGPNEDGTGPAAGVRERTSAGAAECRQGGAEGGGAPP
jgi:hypothetical protein